MTESKPPKIVFPCSYSIRVIGQASADFQSKVTDIVAQHVPDLDYAKISSKPSKNGNFTSVYFVIEATGEAQLTAIHEALKEYPAVKMVL